jgi:hypothetical protein
MDNIKTNNIIPSSNSTTLRKYGNKDDCIELKNINYKNILFNGTSLYEHKNTNDINNLEIFLENEKKNNKIKQWSKLDKCEKLKKLLFFVDLYKIKNNLTMEEEEKLIFFFKELLDKKLLKRVKDVIYDKDKGVIKDIPNLFYNKQCKKFTLKTSSGNKQNTLKSLAPQKKNTNTTSKNIQHLILNPIIINNEINEINEIIGTNEINEINEIIGTNEINEIIGTNEINEINEIIGTNEINRTDEIN